MHTRWLIAKLLALMVLLPSFIQANDGLISIQLPGGVTIQAEVADTAKKRAQGLMYREHLAKDHGMRVARISRKRSPSHGVTEEALEDLARVCDVIVSGIGD